MKITYDENDDVLRILLAETPIETVNRNGSDLTLDYDQHGMLVGLEMRNTARYIKRPGQVNVDVFPSHGSAKESSENRLRSAGNEVR